MSEVYHVPCPYCGKMVTYYNRNYPPVCCLYAECIKKAVADGYYKDFINRGLVVNGPEPEK